MEPHVPHSWSVFLTVYCDQWYQMPLTNQGIFLMLFLYFQNHRVYHYYGMGLKENNSFALIHGSLLLVNAVQMMVE